MSFCSVLVCFDTNIVSRFPRIESYLRWSLSSPSFSASVRLRMSFILRTNCSFPSTITSTLSISRSVRVWTSTSSRMRSSNARAADITSAASLASRSSHLLIQLSMSPCPMSSIIISCRLSDTDFKHRSKASDIFIRSCRAESGAPSRTSAFCTEETTCLCSADPISISAALFWVPSRVSFRSMSVLVNSVTIFVVHSFPSISRSTCLSCVVACVSFSYS
mmetsp:Transcript_18744/g.45036  ORF Transcript_18744/g.45036 Transcript_18744/m.45036 type:complete len:220 (-) Transcript_18744:101-760(-)